MKKIVKYMGITAAMLLAVAPVAAPVFNSATETTVEASHGLEDIEPNGTYVDNGDGTYTLNGSFPVTKDGQTVMIPITNVTGTLDPVQGTMTIKAPTVDGYAANREEVELGLDSGNFYLLSGANEYDKKATDDTSTAGIIYHTDFFANKTTLLYTEDGKEVTNRALGKESAWFADRKMTLNGETYLRVATSEWVKVSDGLEVTAANATITMKDQAEVYTSNGTVIPGVTLPANSKWAIDWQANDLAGQTMYRIANNEWVSVRHLG